MSIFESENKINEAKSEYYSEMQKITNSLNSTETLPDTNARNLLTNWHKKAVNFFNLFERSIDEYGIQDFKLNEDTKNRKIEDCLDLIPRIIKHWQLVKAFSSKYKLTCPVPSDHAYASIQRLIKTFCPDKVEELKEKFMSEQLPTTGFDSKKKHSGWKIGSKKLTVLQIVFGLLFCGASIIIAFANKDLNAFQYLVFRVCLSLGITLIATALIEMNLHINWTIQTALSIKAFGAIALFILIYYLNPPSAPNPHEGNSEISKQIKDSLPD